MDKLKSLFLLAIIGIASTGANPLELGNEDLKGSPFELDKFAEGFEKIQPLDILETLIDDPQIAFYDVNNTCTQDMSAFMLALQQREMWAMKRVDASSKIPSGIFRGNVKDLGVYDECVTADYNAKGERVQGRHCMYSIGVTMGNQTLPINPILSICMPSSCNSTDVTDILNYAINNTNSRVQNLKIYVKSVTCSQSDDIDSGFIATVTIFGILIGFLVFCTLCDFVESKLLQESNSLLQMLSKFSLYRNAQTILSMKTNPGSIPALHGIRFLSMAWVVMGHEYVSQIMTTTNILDGLEWAQSRNSMYIFSALYAVDTFFMLSGLLMAYLVLKELQNGKRFNLVLYYFHRYIRLTPTIIALFLFVVFVLPLMGSGPVWGTSLGPLTQPCRNKWWPFLLYIQNFYDTDNLCLPHLWYVAVDMQLFWISPLIIYPLAKKPKIGLLILTAFAVASVVTPITIVAVNEYPANSYLQGASKILEVFKNIYITPYCRAGPWLIGIILGYEIVMHDRTLSKKASIIGWILSIAAFCFCIIGFRTFLEKDYVYNVYWESAFSGFSRPIWGAAVAWIIYASIKGRAGPLSTFLSSPLFYPFSRISYCVYLVHIVLQFFKAGLIRVPTYFTDFNFFNFFISDLFWSIVLGFFFSLIFESPVMTLEKLLFRRKKESESKHELRFRDSDKSDQGNFNQGYERD